MRSCIQSFCPVLWTSCVFVTGFSLGVFIVRYPFLGPSRAARLHRRGGAALAASYCAHSRGSVAEVATPELIDKMSDERATDTDLTDPYVPVDSPMGSGLMATVPRSRASSFWPSISLHFMH